MFLPICSILKKHQLQKTILPFVICVDAERIISVFLKKKIKILHYKNKTILIKTNNPLISQEIQLKEKGIYKELAQNNIYIEKIKIIL